ncbi:hypothetical protein CVD28_01580 [Bacillus sp. M6-12]|uniref:ADP-ribosyltransferase-containing protein n=1 Tax=Bacillus sp. M6-12 TaxID=2054166 RepID=UPI000C76BA83|nr:hypothetical protein [Bacillus sp. M6-12]PLS19124.1 hypothetical protein CVD28_01580 [Bacillus sp. M6-12]
MLVYHGSKQLFEAFDYSKIGTNGTMEGKGFYFTDKKLIAEGYGQDGYLYTVEFNGKKSLHSDKKTITRQQLKKYLKELDKKTDYLSNWGDTAYDGLEKVLNEAVRGEYEQSDNDVDIIAGIANACGDMETSLTLLYQLLGYDSIVVDGEWGNGQRIYIALTNDIIKIVDVKELKKA